MTESSFAVLAVSLPHLESVYPQRRDCRVTVKDVTGNRADHVDPGNRLQASYRAIGIQFFGVERRDMHGARGNDHPPASHFGARRQYEIVRARTCDCAVRLSRADGLNGLVDPKLLPVASQSPSSGHESARAVDASVLRRNRQSPPMSPTPTLHAAACADTTRRGIARAAAFTPLGRKTDFHEARRR